MDLEWKNPPPKPGGESSRDFRAVADALKKQPQAWARVDANGPPTTGKAYRRWFNKYYPFTYDVRVHKNIDGTFDTYIRYAVAPERSVLPDAFVQEARRFA